jgi:hypothetical protein
MPGPRAILITGITPDAVDYSDPALPPGMTAEKSDAGLAAAQKRFTCSRQFINAVHRHAPAQA